MYSDGDEEDLSLAELLALGRLTKRHNRVGSKKRRQQEESEALQQTANDSCLKKKAHSHFPGSNKPSVGRFPAASRSRCSTSLGRGKMPPVPLREVFCNEGVPIDMAAEATLAVGKHVAKRERSVSEKAPEEEVEEDEETDIWLEKVAVLLGAGAPSSKVVTGRQKKHMGECDTLSSLNSDSGGSVPNAATYDTNSRRSSVSSISNDARDTAQAPKHALTFLGPLPSAALSSALVPLADIQRGKRHGNKVFHVRDTKRTVGEVRKAVV